MWYVSISIKPCKKRQTEPRHVDSAPQEGPAFQSQVLISPLTMVSVWGPPKLSWSPFLRHRVSATWRWDQRPALVGGVEGPRDSWWDGQGTVHTDQ